MRRARARRGQVGRYWIDKRKGRDKPTDPYCKFWYEDKPIRQTRCVSLGTTDFDEAYERLISWYAEQRKEIKGRPEDVLIDDVLVTYWEEHGKNLPSAATQKYNLAKWHEFFDGKTVGEITPAQQRSFRKFLGEGSQAPSSIDKILSAGRAALNWSVEFHELTTFPRITLIETEQDKQSRPEMGRPITIPEMARLFEAAEQRYVFCYMMFLANTLARPEAILQFRRNQFDVDHGLLSLNPPGRRQTKKYRPTLPATQSLLPWLKAEVDPNAYYVAYRGERILSLKNAWNRLRVKARLPDVTAYSFRHGMARELRKRKVPFEEIKLFLGHKPLGSDKTTSIYAPFDPEYCVEARDAIDEIMSEVRRCTNRANFENPDALDDEPNERTPSRHLSKSQKAWMIELIDQKAKTADIARELGVSFTAIYKTRKKHVRGNAN